jgi:hypothetical protein
MTKYLGLNNIDRVKLRGVRKTVFIVGRFRPRRGPGPELFLFTRKKVSPLYAAQFAGVGGLTYEEFTRLVEPTIGQYRMPLGDRFQPMVYRVPDDGDPPQALTRVDETDPLFHETVAYSSQEHYGGGPSAARGAVGDPGRAVFANVVHGLDDFVMMQPRNGELVDLVSSLLARVASQNGLPAYPEQGALPPGLPELWWRLLYCDDARAEAALDDLDFSAGPWQALEKSAAGRESLQAALLALRDVVLGINRQQYNGVTFGGKSLTALAREVVRGKDDLLTAFRRARAGRRLVLDTLYSQPRLGLSLRWVLRAVYQRVEKALGPFADEADADEKVEAEVLSTSGAVLPPAVKRPTREQRRAFAKEMRANFAALVEAVVAPDKEYADRVKALSAPMKALVEEVRNDPARRRLIVAISGADRGAAMTQAFIRAAQTILADVLLPALYRVPVLGVGEVKDQLRNELMALYLAAVLMSEQTDAELRAIAGRRMDLFEQWVDQLTEPGADAAELVSVLLKDFVEALAHPSTAEQLTEGVRVLHEVLTLYETGEKEREEQLLRSLRQSQRKGSAGVLGRTRPARKQLRRRVAAVVRTRVAARVHALQQAAASAAPAAKNGKKPARKPAPPRPAAGAPDDEAPRSEHLEKIDAFVSHFLPAAPDKPLTAESREQLTGQVVERVMADETFIGTLEKDFTAFDGLAHLIFRRYAEPRNRSRKEFRRKVRRMTVLNLLLQEQAGLALGLGNSSYYQLLTDMVETIDEEDLDPEAFVREKPLTLYYDNETLQGGGMTALRQSLDVMGAESQRNLIGFLSELRGIEYLFSLLAGNEEVEIIIFNGSAADFTNWLRADSLTLNQGRGLMRLGGLLTTNQASDRSIVPGLIYLTDSAFPSGNKTGFAASLPSLALANAGLGVVLPTLVLSTGPQGTNYEQDAADILRAGEGAPVGLLVVAPSPPLNDPGSEFPTYLPAGYPLLAEFLAQPEQRIRVENVGRVSRGRVQAIGYGRVGLHKSLEQVLWGAAAEEAAPDDGGEEGADGEAGGASAAGPDDVIYALEADLYAYLILSLIGAAAYSGDSAQPNAAAFYGQFYSRPDDPASMRNFQASAPLGEALHGGDAMRLTLDQQLGANGNSLVSVTVAPPWGPNLLDDGARRLVVRNMQWVDRCRKAAGLP